MTIEKVLITATLTIGICGLAVAARNFLDGKRGRPGTRGPGNPTGKPPVVPPKKTPTVPPKKTPPHVTQHSVGCPARPLPRVRVCGGCGQELSHRSR